MTDIEAIRARVEGKALTLDGLSQAVYDRRAMLAAYDEKCAETAHHLEARLNAGKAMQEAQNDAHIAEEERDRLRAEVDALRKALELAYNAMCAPIDDWKGVLEAKALQAYHASIAQERAK